MIERGWDRVRRDTQSAGAIRVDPEHPADFFAAIDAGGRPGLVLVLDVPPPHVPRLESLDVTLTDRSDGRRGLGIWLDAPQLLTPFTQLCEDLLESSRPIEKREVGAFVVTRLLRWQELLERTTGVSINWLRGLLAELLVLRDGFDTWGPGEMVRAWHGPFEAPQDFSLPGLLIEVKAAFPTARAIRVTSEDQLSAPERLLLCVRWLATLMPEDGGLTTGRIVADIEQRLKENALDDEAAEFARRLVATGYVRTAEYTNIPFREDAARFFLVEGDFPRLTPADLMSGINQVKYDVDLGSIEPFVTASPFEGKDGP